MSPSARLLVVIACCVALCVVSTANAVTIRVPADAPTIKAGILAAVEGDSVVIACGTYHERNIGMKSGITLRSETGNPDCVTIDADSLALVLKTNGADSTTVIEGITFQRGYAVDGAGLLLRYYDGRVTRCKIINNIALSNGGGILCFGGKPRLESCTIASNRSNIAGGNAAFGATIHAYVSDLSISNCTIASNTVRSYVIYQQTSLGQGTLKVSRTIIALNTPSTSWNLSALANCCNVFRSTMGGQGAGSSGNFFTNPLLCEPASGNFGLQFGSPCLPDNNGCGVLIGAHGLGCGQVGNIAVTIATNPTALPVQVDGSTFTSPAIFQWQQYSMHQVAVDSLIENAPGGRQRYLSWSNGGSRSQTYMAPANPTTLQATFKQQYQLEMQSLGQGTLTPGTGWHDISATVQIRCIPGSSNFFDHWVGTGSGSYSGTLNPVNIQMLGPILEQAHYQSKGYHFTVSASATDPFVSTSSPTNAIRNLYLWMACTNVGLSAMETGTSGSLPPLGFVPMNGVLNVGTAENLLLAVPNCPSSALCMGYWIVLDSGGDFCLAPSAANARIAAVDCDVVNPWMTVDPLVTGFSSAGAPCHIGTNGCTGAPGAPAIASDAPASSVSASRVDLSAARPNPFRKTTELELTLPVPSEATISIYDVTGRRVRVLIHERLDAGAHRITWDGRGEEGSQLQSGVYFIRIEAGATNWTRKVVLLRSD